MAYASGVLAKVEIGPLSLQTFGIFFALNFVAWGAVAHRSYKENGWNGEWAYETVFVGLLGGLVGARLWFVIQNYDEVRHDLLGNLFSGSGLVWYGGLLGGIAAVAAWARWRGVLSLRLWDVAAYCLPLGYAIGRIGCQVSGDGDYGIASGLPWAMPYPHGTVPTNVAVHPTPIYETLVMGLAAWWLWRMRHAYRPGVLFGIYLLIAGLERFLVEFIRRNSEVAGPFTAAQVSALVAVALGVVWLWALTRRGPLRREPSAPPAAAPARPAPA